MKLLGTLAGVPDLSFFYKGSFRNIELKAKGGSMSPSQEAFKTKLEANGGHYLLADNLDDALSFLSIAGILR